MQTIGIINPSMVIEPFCPKRCKRAIDLLHDNGFEIVLGELTSNVQEIYRSGTIKQRVEEFHKMVQNQQVDVIMVSIGGQNTASLIDLIDYDLVEANPKIYIGYSDATSLLHAIKEKTNRRVLYGMSLSSSFGEPGYFGQKAVENLKLALSKEHYVYKKSKYVTNEYIDWEQQQSEKTKYANSFETYNFQGFNGRLVGGNLATLASLCGTPYLMQRKNQDVLYLETEGTDIGMLEKYLIQLKQNAYFSDLAGIILGKTEFIKDYGLNRTLIDLINEILPNNNIPIYDGFDAAHTFPSDLLELGKNINITADGIVSK